MPVESRDAGHLWDIVQSAEAIALYIAGKSLHDYLEDRQLRSAVERELEIIGEAARRLSSRLREEHGEIPWTSIIAQRNVLAHEYEKIEHDRIWRVAAELLPQVCVTLQVLLPPLPPGDSTPGG